MTNTQAFSLGVAIMFAAALISIFAPRYQFLRVDGDGLYRCDTLHGYCERITIEGRLAP